MAAVRQTYAGSELELPNKRFEKNPFMSPVLAAAVCASPLQVIFHCAPLLRGGGGRGGGERIRRYLVRFAIEYSRRDLQLDN